MVECKSHKLATLVRFQSKASHKCEMFNITFNTFKKMNKQLSNSKKDMDKIWQSNYYLLKALEPGQKLVVVNKSQLEIDDRYLRWIRRRLTRNGPSELIIPITQTFENITEPYIDITRTLKHLQLVLKKTYPDDHSGLLERINVLFAKFKKMLPKSSNMLFNLLDESEYRLYCGEFNGSAQIVQKKTSENSENKDNPIQSISL